MSRLIDFYRTQLRVLWEWKGGPSALLRRLILTLVVAAVSFGLTAALLRSITIDSVWAAIAAVIVMALLNAVVRPVVLMLATPISLILVAVLVLVYQVVSFLVVAAVVPGVHIDGFIGALIGSFVYAIINSVLTALLGVDRGGSYFGALVQRLLVRRAAAPTDQPGVVILQIDGLAHPIMAGRIRAGSVNTIAGWIRDRS